MKIRDCFSTPAHNTQKLFYDYRTNNSVLKRAALITMELLASKTGAGNSTYLNVVPVHVAIRRTADRGSSIACALFHQAVQNPAAQHRRAMHNVVKPTMLRAGLGAASFKDGGFHAVGPYGERCIDVTGFSIRLQYNFLCLRKK